MKLKYVIPNMEATFGNLEFAGAAEPQYGETTRNFGRVQYLKRRFKLFSDVQKATDIEVVVSGKAGPKSFSQFQRVKLVNPRLDVGVRVVQQQGYPDYILYADDIIEA